MVVDLDTLIDGRDADRRDEGFPLGQPSCFVPFS